MPETQPEKLMHYQIIETLGSGGNGTVYRAVNSRDQSVVALKTLKNANEVTLNRFKREFLSLKKMDDPGIVRVYEGFFEHNPPFFSMEWVKGKTLSDVLQDMENNPMVFNVADRENFAIRLGLQVCDILIYIHGFEEVHRDLKPDNLFITLESGNIMSRFIVKMLDFGLLKQVGEDREKTDEEDTQGGMIVGTVHYLSPEQAKGTNVDPRSDLYSLGVILYKAISLRLPYEAPDVVGYIFKTVFEDPAPIETHTPECSKTMQALLKDLLAKDASKRPPTAAVLKRRLKSMLEPKTSDVMDIQAGDLEFDFGVEGFGSPLLPPPLVGREDVIQRLSMQTEATLPGQPRAMVLIGEPGMGRTSIIKEWKSRVRINKPVFMQAHFSEELIPSQDPIGMLLDSLIRTMKPEEVRKVFRDVYPFLAGSSRYLGRFFDTKSVGRFDHLSPGRKLQVLAINFIKLINTLEKKGPVVMILEDMHYAPERFYGWLTLFWEQLGRSRLQLIFSCSPEMHQACAQFRQRLEEVPETETLELKALTMPQTLELLQAMLPIGSEVRFSDKLQKLLMERANGNPFYSTELFSRLYEDEHLSINRGVLDIDSVSDLDVPHSIHQALLKKVNRLPKDGLYLLQTAAVFGVYVDYQVLVNALQWPEEKFLTTLLPLLQQSIMAEEEEPIHRLLICAPALQQILYEKIPAKGIPIFHENAARAIESCLKQDDVLALEQLATHYTKSGNYVRAIKFAYLAGNSALDAKETEKAIHFYRLSLQMMDKMENKQARNLVNLKLAEVYLDDGKPNEALDYYNSSLGLEHLSKIERLRALRGRMMCFETMNRLDDAFGDAEELAKIGQTCSKRIQAETLSARGRLFWLSQGRARAWVRDLMKAKVVYPKLGGWKITAPYAQIMSNETSAARKHLLEMVKQKIRPSFPLYLQLAALRYFSGNFPKAHDYLKQARPEKAGVGAETDPSFMVAHALLTYKIQSTMNPDHSSKEYLGIADRYISRFGLDDMKTLVTLTQLEHHLINHQFGEAWEMVSAMVRKSVDLPPGYHDQHLFVCLAVRAAWEVQERPPRGWLIRFQKFAPDEDAPFILQTHYALALAAEAMLPLSTTGPKALSAIKSTGDLLVKLKFKYYYRSLLIKEITLLKRMGKEEQAANLEKLRAQIDKSLGVVLPE